MKDNTFEKIAEHFAVSGQEIRLLLKDAEKISFTPKDIVVHEREINSNLYFITQGVWRAYTFKDGVEVTLWFVSEGEMALSVWGYTSNLPSHLTLEVVTDSEAYCLSRSKLEQLFQSSISLANLGRKILENFMLEIEVAWLYGLRTLRHPPGKTTRNHPGCSFEIHRVLSGNHRSIAQSYQKSFGGIIEAYLRKPGFFYNLPLYTNNHFFKGYFTACLFCCHPGNAYQSSTTGNLHNNNSQCIDPGRIDHTEDSLLQSNLGQAIASVRFRRKRR